MFSDRRGVACALAAVTVLLAGCSSSGGGESNAVAPAPGAEQAQSDSSAEQSESDPGSGPIGMSPGGVTTRIDVPAQSTEEQYAQACLAAKEWMSGKGGDPHTLVEPFLKQLQGSKESGPATFKKAWAELDDANRAAVIIAVRAAADGGC